MKPGSGGILLTAFLLCGAHVSAAKPKTLDLVTLSKKARPAVMLLVVSDARGQAIGRGTGFLVSSNGLLVTNHHVIEDGASEIAKAENGQIYAVERVVADDPQNDVAILKLKGDGLPYLKLADSNAIEVGTRIVVVGNPRGLEGTVSEGIISAIRDLMGSERMLQITAPISPGSSGSPVLNAQGEVVGVVKSLLPTGQNLNFAAPVECVARLLGTPTPAVDPAPEPHKTGRKGEVAVYADPEYKAATTAEAAQDYPTMLEHARALVKKRPRSAVAQFTLGVALANSKSLVEATEAFAKAVKLNPEYIDAWVCSGMVYASLGKTETAIGACRKALQVDPDSAKAWFHLGRVAGDKDRKTALEAFQHYTTLRPTDVNGWRELGLQCVAAKEFKVAVKTLEVGYQLKSNDVMVCAGLGAAHMGLFEFQEAYRYLRQALDLQENNEMLWGMLGNLYMASSQPDDAEKAFRRSIKLKPNYATGWYGLSRALRQSGNIVEADKALQQAHKLDPTVDK